MHTLMQHKQLDYLKDKHKIASGGDCYKLENKLRCYILWVQDKLVVQVVLLLFLSLKWENKGRRSKGKGELQREGGEREREIGSVLVSDLNDLVKAYSILVLEME